MKKLINSVFIIIIISFIFYCFYLQSINGHSVGDGKFLNPFLYEKGTFSNANTIGYSDPRGYWKDIYITSEQLQTLKFKKMKYSFLYISPVLVLFFIYNFYLKRKNISTL